MQSRHIFSGNTDNIVAAFLTHTQQQLLQQSKGAIDPAGRHWPYTHYIFACMACLLTKTTGQATCGTHTIYSCATVAASAVAVCACM